MSHENLEQKSDKYNKNVEAGIMALNLLSSDKINEVPREVIGTFNNLKLCKDFDIETPEGRKSLRKEVYMEFAISFLGSRYNNLDYGKGKNVTPIGEDYFGYLQSLGKAYLKSQQKTKH